MKKNIILFAIVVLTPLRAFSQEQSGIHFETDSFSVLLAKAKQKNKLLFIDCYTTWCGPCKWMDKNVFVNDTAADFYNANFICAKIDMEKGEGIDLKSRYDVRCYPTYLFIDGSGQLLHRKSGAQPVQAFVDLGKEALTPENRFVTCKSANETNTFSPDRFVAYMKMRQASCLPVDAEVDKYFSGDTVTLAASPYTWIVLRDFPFAPHSKACLYLLSHQELLAKQHSADSVNIVLERCYANALAACVFRKEGVDTVEYKKLRGELIDRNFSFSERVSLMMDMFYYQALLNWQEYARTCVLYIPKYVRDDAFTLNNAAWVFYEHIDDTLMLDSAISWSIRAVSLQPDFYITDTYAALLYKRGRKVEAQIQAERAIALARQANDDPEREKKGYALIDYSGTEELLKKIKAMR